VEIMTHHEHSLSVSTYLVVFAALVLLTILTVSVSFFELPGRWHAGIGVTIALVKASLVVLFFMHAVLNARLDLAGDCGLDLWILLMFSLTATDYFTRSLVPFAPGH